MEKLLDEGLPFQEVNDEGAISAYKAVMDELSNQNQRLQQFAHIVSHNLRSHSGNLELMLKMFRETDDQEERELFLSQIENISSSLSETIHNLTKVVQVNGLTTRSKVVTKLGWVIKNALNTLQADLDHAGAKVFVSEYGWEELPCEPAYLDSIVLNLLCNAIKYRHPDRIPEIHIETALEGNKKLLKIRDNGLGIDLDLYGDKLFELYKTFHKNKDARGVGLFITKSQVEAMGGRIWAESTPGVGSQFTVEF
ncbi:MAG: sensor histidine kinase [Bacteroidia bacterium]